MFSGQTTMEQFARWKRWDAWLCRLASILYLCHLRTRSMLFDIGGATIRRSSAAKDAGWSLEWHELFTIGILFFFLVFAPFSRKAFGRNCLAGHLQL